MSSINSIENSNEPDLSRMCEIVQSFIRKLNNSSDESADEAVKSLSSSFDRILRAFESKSNK